MAYKQVVHDIRVSFSDSSAPNKTIINNLTQQYIISNPSSYNSSRIILLDLVELIMSDINFIYLSSDNQIKVFINNSVQELMVQHLSYVNLEEPFDIKLINVTGQASSEVQLFYGSTGE